MQMYRVRFARKLPNDRVDMGDCVVCASNNDAASDLVASVFGFPVSGAQFEVVRVKPSLYLIGRRDVEKRLTSAIVGMVDASLASSATFPGTTENMKEQHWHDVEATASVRAEDENAAIEKLARCIMSEMMGEKQKSSVRELEIRCDRKDYRPRSPAVEQNSLYTHLRFFKGGDTRT